MIAPSSGKQETPVPSPVPAPASLCKVDLPASWRDAFAAPLVDTKRVGYTVADIPEGTLTVEYFDHANRSVTWAPTGSAPTVIGTLGETDAVVGISFESGKMAWTRRIGSTLASKTQVLLWSGQGESRIVAESPFGGENAPISPIAPPVLKQGYIWWTMDSTEHSERADLVRIDPATGEWKTMVTSVRDEVWVWGDLLIAVSVDPLLQPRDPSRDLSIAVDTRTARVVGLPPGLTFPRMWDSLSIDGTGRAVTSFGDGRLAVSLDPTTPSSSVLIHPLAPQDHWVVLKDSGTRGYVVATTWSGKNRETSILVDLQSKSYAFLPSRASLWHTFFYVEGLGSPVERKTKIDDLPRLPTCG